MGINKKQILDFDLNSNPDDDVSFILQTSDGVTERTTKSALLNNVNTSLIGLQTQIDGISGIDNIYDLRGKKTCNIGQQIYSITTGVTITDPTPIISLTVPTSASTLFIQGIYDITSTDFKVVLSEAPSSTGYIINWSVKTSSVLPNTISFIELTDTPSSYSGHDGYLVAISGNSLYFKQQEEFDPSSLETLIETISSSNLNNSNLISQLQTISGDHETRIYSLENNTIVSGINDLFDVNVSNIQEGQALTYSQAMSAWTNSFITVGASGSYVEKTGDTMTGTLHTTNLIPISANTYSLGTSAFPYKDLFLSPSTIHLGTDTLSIVDNRLQLNDSYIVAWQEVAISGDYTVSTTNNLILKTYTTSNAIDITIANQTSGQRIKVIDVGEFAGTNIITIAPISGSGETIEGLPSRTIENNGGTLELIYNDEWEISDSFTNFFNRNAATGIISTIEDDTLAVTKLFSGAVAEPFTGTVADFTNAGANVDQGANDWGNTSSLNNFFGTQTIVGGDLLAGSSSFFGAGASSLTDALQKAIGTTAVGTNIFYLNGSFVVDLGSSRTVDMIKFAGFGVDANSSFQQVGRWRIEGSDTSDSTGYTDLFYNISDTETAYQTTVTRTFASRPLRWIRVSCVNAANGFGTHALLFSFGATVYATTTNTFDYNILTSGATKTFSTNTFSPVDQTDTSLVNGDIIIQYTTDGSTWSPQYSLNDFKALGTITSDTFWLRFEMVGSKRFKQATIQTASSYSQMQLNGLEIVVDSVMVGQITNNGTSLTGNLTTTGNISGSAIYGDGSNLTNLPLSNYATLSAVNSISGDLDLLETYTTGITGGLTQLNDTFIKSNGTTTAGNVNLSVNSSYLASSTDYALKVTTDSASNFGILAYNNGANNQFYIEKSGTSYRMATLGTSIAITHGSDNGFYIGNTKNIIIGASPLTGKTISIYGAITSRDSLTVQDTTESTSISGGSFKTSGGVGIAKNLHVGGTINILDVTFTNTISAGSFTTTGEFLKIITPSGDRFINLYEV